jgi:hypothetical protein
MTLEGGGQKRSNTVFPMTNHVSDKCLQMLICSSLSHMVHLEGEKYDFEDTRAFITCKYGKN